MAGRGGGVFICVIHLGGLEGLFGLGFLFVCFGFFVGWFGVFFREIMS